MKITVVATLCHALSATSPAAVCREEIIVQDDMPMQACVLSQAAIADWKDKTIYRADEWRIAGIRCVQGSYSPRGAI